MAFTKEQRREWRKQPHVKERQRQSVRRFYERQAKHYRISAAAVSRLEYYGLRSDQVSAIDAIRQYELKRIEAKQKQSQLAERRRIESQTSRNHCTHPIVPCPCVICSALTDRQAYCEKCKDKYYRRYRGKGKRDSDRIARNKRSRERYRTDEGYRTLHKIKAGIRNRLATGLGVNTWKWLGYSYEELKARLLQTIPNGYTWDDVISGSLEIDHIDPLASFPSTEQGVWQAYRLSNLQLLPALDNREKSSGSHKTFKPKSKTRPAYEPSLTQNTCVTCGKDFSSPRKKLCCSGACDSRRRKGRTLSQDNARTCVQCGTSIKGTFGKRRKCAECARKLSLRAKLGVTHKHCLVCGTSLEGEHGSRKRCKRCASKGLKVNSERVCALCGVDMSGYHGNRVTCDECR